ncbi:Na+-transporting NADH:ubiquinone oxidoreductase subunit D [Hoeflea halophila]|uniref:Na+-transporting NADH:ubiquinone oxidoreductase subunit D n=1 Tax=Hoeflea halophila TaxID=714899 RepID=A0A286IDN0_9HYPH|nr:NADH:ubiquinone reductase (Na(+)-transporting) subunit D [Hoeflea halophila]SOE18235.1 Na+-transporting NADH:ubiquinone oxidoreductase subunit D [Hoeflea halophila]
MAMREIRSALITNNPVTQQILGICSALAVSTSVATALTMSMALTAVLCTSNVIISSIRHHIPPSIRLIVQITIIASLVIVTDQILQAYAFELSRQLSIFVGLIVTNCLVLGRAEAFASRNPVGPSAIDGLANALGYSLILLLVGTVREVLGQGTWFAMTVFPLASNGGWFEPIGLMTLAPSAYFVIGFLIWAIRSKRRDLVERTGYGLRREELSDD